jgi:hypothetical protein
MIFLHDTTSLRLMLFVCLDCSARVCFHTRIFSLPYPFITCSAFTSDASFKAWLHSGAVGPHFALPILHWLSPDAAMELVLSMSSLGVALAQEVWVPLCFFSHL